MTATRCARPYWLAFLLRLSEQAGPAAHSIPAWPAQPRVRASPSTLRCRLAISRCYRDPREKERDLLHRPSQSRTPAGYCEPSAAVKGRQGPEQGLLPECCSTERSEERR